jgi:signal transduction histidine kinase
VPEEMMKQGSGKTDIQTSLDFLTREKFYFDHILNSSRSMISVINRDYVYVKVNAAFCDAQRGVSDSIIGKSLGDVWGDDIFNSNIKKNIDRCFAGDTIKYEASFTTPQSGKRYFEVIFRPFPADSGQITHLLAETFDITDLKLTEKIAIEKEEEFRKFETNLPIGFLRCKPNGRILHGNRSFLLIMDCNSENSLSSSNLRDYYAEKGIFDLQVEQLADSKPKSFGRVSLITYSGKEIVCRISGFMSLDETGKPSYIDFAFEDSSRELMLENRLLEAQKLETIGALAGGIAHDFNNILATISGYSELLIADLPSQSLSSEKVAKIQMAVNKARSLTNQILAFSRQVEQEKVPVSVYEVLRETIGFVKSTAPPNVTIKSSYKGKQKHVFADPTQLFRVFLNLMTNAIQALEDKTGTITVTLTIEDGKKVRGDLNKVIVADEYFLVTFCDTGKGMDPSLLRRIFEPFFTTCEVGKGSGLGLSVVHGIVSEMDGAILVSSNKGAGSIFYVYLPVSGEKAGLPGFSGRKKKLLFITGNKHESRILFLALESAGFEMIQSSELKHFNKMLADPQARPDIIIYMSDAEQIRIDDLVYAFQKYGVLPPCIIITDSNLNIAGEKLLNSGIITQHLIKPVSLKELETAIQLSIKR